eukprot:s661_g1.t1
MTATFLAGLARAAHSPAACFASWADSLGALRVREPDSCHFIVRLLDDATSAPSLPRCLSSLAGAVRPLCDTGFQPPAFGQPRTSLSTLLEAGSRPPPVLSMMASPVTSVQRLTLLPLPCWSLSPGRVVSFEGSHCPASCHKLTLDSRALRLRRLRLSLPLEAKPVAAAVPLTLSVTTVLFALAVASCAAPCPQG